MSDLNDKELTTWGFTKGMRTGLITFLLAVMMSSIGVLFKLVLSEKDKSAEKTEKLYKEIIDRVDQKVDSKMAQPIKAINDVVSKVDTAAQKATSSAERVDSLTNKYTKKLK